MVHETSYHAVAFHVTQLLNQHLFGHCRDRTAQLRKPAHVPAEQMEEDHELPSTLEYKDMELFFVAGDSDAP